MIIYMYLFQWKSFYLLLWCFFIVKNVKTEFLFSVNAYVFIPMMLFYG